MAPNNLEPGLDCYTWSGPNVPVPGSTSEPTPEPQQIPETWDGAEATRKPGRRQRYQNDRTMPFDTGNPAGPRKIKGDLQCQTQHRGPQRTPPGTSPEEGKGLGNIVPAATGDEQKLVAAPGV